MAAPSAGGTAPWWAGRVGYEVYLRSFADGDGDGIGDLAGLLGRLDHLAWLGVDLVWITPFYPSPMADHGYDITDHVGVDPRYGTLADFDAVVARCHDLGLRVLVDLVPNHTSSEHPWFAASRSDRQDPKRGWYHWHPGRAGGPPNNWLSYFGGPAWTLDPGSGEWYCHLFLPDQPDLNWSEPAVRDAFDEVLRFWIARGVDGFRVDVAQGLAKHPDYPDDPVLQEEPAGPSARDAWATLDHRYDVAQPASLDVFRRWRRLAPPEVVLLGEVYLEAERIGPYLHDGGLDLAFSFAFAALPWDADAVRTALQATYEHLGAGACWTQTSHDEPRPPTRFGGGARGRQRALAVATLLAGMPGLFVLYQGEELGLEDGVVPPESAEDPLGDRDGCRTPLPWSTVPGWGFTKGVPWLPMDDRVPADSVEVQRGDERSPLHRVRRLLDARRRIDPDVPVEWSSTGAVVAYRRGAHQVAAAIADTPEPFDPGPGAWTMLFSTDPDRPPTEVDGPFTLAPAEAVVLERRGAP